MSIMGSGDSRFVAEPLETLVRLTRRALSAAGLSVVREFDISGCASLEPRAASGSCVILLVDTPELLFEATALDRAAAVFLPLHVVISGDRDNSSLYWTNPVASSGLRAPAPAKGPLESLCARLRKALSELPHAGEMALKT